MIYSNPNQADSKVHFKKQYENYIDGNWQAPIKSVYFENISPVNGQVFCKIPRSTADDIDLALDAAHKAKDSWGKTSVTVRSNILLKIADRIEQNL
jgi:aldehyde dehydrogenase